MNRNKILTFACAVAIATAPLHSEAATRGAGLTACADALVSKLSVDNGAPLGFQLGNEQENSGIRMNQREIYHLDVKDPKTQEIVARADCVVDRSARVRRLISVPLKSDDAPLRALNF